MSDYYDLEDLTPERARLIVDTFSKLNVDIPAELIEYAEVMDDVPEAARKLSPMTRLVARDLVRYEFEAIIPIVSEADREMALDAILAAYDKPIIYLKVKEINMNEKVEYTTYRFDNEPRITVLEGMTDYFSVTNHRRDDLIVYEYPGAYSRIPTLIGSEFNKRVCLVTGMSGDPAAHLNKMSAPLVSLKRVIQDFYPGLDFNAPFLNSRKKSIPHYKVIPYLNKFLRSE